MANVRQSKIQKVGEVLKEYTKKRKLQPKRAQQTNQERLLKKRTQSESEKKDRSNSQERPHRVLQESKKANFPKLQN
jgi:hypothetical protein